METTLEPVAGDASTKRRRLRVLRRPLGWILIAAGVLMLAWSFVVWQWNDPVTALYTRWHQGRLTTEYEQLAREERQRLAAADPRASPAEMAQRIASAARQLRHGVGEGDAIGRLSIPRLGLDMVVVDGTTSETLKKGPGLHRATFMPGEGEIVYVAGHRTTYGAPFAHIDRLQPGDAVSMTMPYGKVDYVVTGHTIVDDEDLSVLRPQGHEVLALQACHPRFFATRRYIVWAKPQRIVSHTGVAIQAGRA